MFNSCNTLLPNLDWFESVFILFGDPYVTCSYLCLNKARGSRVLKQPKPNQSKLSRVAGSSLLILCKP
jgi:hypothetical protein